MLGHNSFAAGTGVVTGIADDASLITTDIATLEVGDVVLANDELSPDGDPHYALVTGVSSRTVYELYELTYIDDAGNVEALQTTADHELYARSLAGTAGWRRAHSLQAGDQLLQPDGTWSTVTGNTLEMAPAGVTVYNLSVSDGSTYFVEDGQGNASAVWVHNCNVKFAVAKAASKKLNLNHNDAISHFGIYDIWVNGKLYKIGKADLLRVTKRSGLPTRLHRQLRELRKIFGKNSVDGRVVIDLGTVTTLQAKNIEKITLKKEFKKIGIVLLGNRLSFKP